MCSDLKNLYVAITRSKLRLIICEESNEKGEWMISEWSRKGLIQEDSIPFRGFMSQPVDTVKIDWVDFFTALGMTFLQSRLFSEAMKCFSKSNKSNLVMEAKACHLAEKGSDLLNGYIADKTQGELTHDSVKNYWKAMHKFSIAASIFESLQKWKESGQCYFSSRQYQKAAELFSAAKAWTECGESLIQIDKFEEAAMCYEKEGDFKRAVGCYQQCGLLREALICINKFKLKMGDEERISYIATYLKRFATSLMQSKNRSDERDYRWDKYEESLIPPEVELPEIDISSDNADLPDIIEISASDNRSRSYPYDYSHVDEESKETEVVSGFTIRADSHQEANLLDSESNPLIETEEYHSIELPPFFTAIKQSQTDLFSPITDTNISKSNYAKKIVWAVWLFRSDLGAYLNKSRSKFINKEKRRIDEKLLMTLEVLECFDMSNALKTIANDFDLEITAVRSQIGFAFSRIPKFTAKSDGKFQKTESMEEAEKINAAETAVQCRFITERNENRSTIGLLEQGLTLLGYTDALAATSSECEFARKFLCAGLGFGYNFDFLPKTRDKIMQLYVCLAREGSANLHNSGDLINIIRALGLDQSFPSNLRYWYFVQHPEASDFQDELKTMVSNLLDYFTESGSSALFRLADTALVLVQFVLALNSPHHQALLNKSNPQTIDNLLRCVTFVLSALKGKVLFVYPPDAFLAVFIESVFAAAGVFRIFPSELTGCLPIYSHFLMSQESILFEAASAKTKKSDGDLIPFDLSKGHYYVNMELIADLLFERIFQNMWKLIVGRATHHWMKFDFFSRMNLYGEIMWILSLKQRLLNKPLLIPKDEPRINEYDAITSLDIASHKMFEEYIHCEQGRGESSESKEISALAQKALQCTDKILNDVPDMFFDTSNLMNVAQSFLAKHAITLIPNTIFIDLGTLIRLEKLSGCCGADLELNKKLSSIQNEFKFTVFPKESLLNCDYQAVHNWCLTRVEQYIKVFENRRFLVSETSKSEVYMEIIKLLKISFILASIQHGDKLEIHRKLVSQIPLQMHGESHSHSVDGGVANSEKAYNCLQRSILSLNSFISKGLRLECISRKEWKSIATLALLACLHLDSLDSVSIKCFNTIRAFCDLSKRFTIVDDQIEQKVTISLNNWKLEQIKVNREDNFAESTNNSEWYFKEPSRHISLCQLFYPFSTNPKRTQLAQLFKSLNILQSKLLFALRFECVTHRDLHYIQSLISEISDFKQSLISRDMSYSDLSAVASFLKSTEAQMSTWRRKDFQPDFISADKFLPEKIAP